MQIHTNINHLPLFKNAVLTIGSFDGVHEGHKTIIDQLIKEATSIKGTAVVITFYPHPKMVIGNNAAPIQVLNTREEKYLLLKKAGIEHIVEVPFTRDFAQQTAEEYIRNFLVEKFHPHTIIIGYDHKFGNNREGDYRMLEDYTDKYKYRVKEIPEHVLQDITISSTKIRKALLSGDIDTAKQYLGYPYFFSGLVVKGNQLGRTIGFPTANIVFTETEKLVPSNGVYAVTVKRNGHSEILKGMMNIGTRPTVGEGLQRTIEVNILDFNEDIYGEMLTVHFVKWLRPELRFNGLEELKDAIQKDKETCEELIRMGEM